QAEKGRHIAVELRAGVVRAVQADVARNEDVRIDLVSLRRMRAPELIAVFDLELVPVVDLDLRSESAAMTPRCLREDSRRAGHALGNSNHTFPESSSP